MRIRDQLREGVLSLETARAEHGIHSSEFRGAYEHLLAIARRDEKERKAP